MDIEEMTRMSNELKKIREMMSIKIESDPSSLMDALINFSVEIARLNGIYEAVNGALKVLRRQAIQQEGEKGISFVRYIVDSSDEAALCENVTETMKNLRQITENIRSCLSFCKVEMGSIL